MAAIGVFDGVHDGHRALIADTAALAHEHDALSVVMTFDRDPEQVVQPERHVPQLLTLEEKLGYIERLERRCGACHPVLHAYGQDDATAVS